MAIKVFCGEAHFEGYQTNPPDIFLIVVSYRIHEDTGGENNGPRYVESMSTLYMPLNSTPLDVYEQLFDEIVATAIAEGYSTPTKADVYGFVPFSFATLIPD